MANFGVHAVGAVGVGAFCSAILGTTDLLPLTDMGSSISMVALGGIMPDVDSERSEAITLVFNLLGISVAVPVAVVAMGPLGLLAGLGVLVAAFATVRFVLIVPFRSMTVHRGRFHSIPTGLLMCCGVATLAARGLDMGPLQAWIYGALFGAGFLTHLILDEMYSVDLANCRIKRSMGSALKLFDRDEVLPYLGLYLLLLAGFALAPPPGALIDALQSLQIKLMPDEWVLHYIEQLAQRTRG
ncbi:MAG TPA: hypothetical protein ENK18_27980 [Deltaproteobacteria bacterium]|nr:hypothetical protein [Deltaproteobacteria bacterium]